MQGCTTNTIQVSNDFKASHSKGLSIPHEKKGTMTVDATPEREEAN